MCIATALVLWILYSYLQHKHASEYAVAQQHKHDAVAATAQTGEDRLRRIEDGISELWTCVLRGCEGRLRLVKV